MFAITIRDPAPGDVAANVDCLVKGHRFAPIDLRCCARCGYTDESHPGYKWFDLVVSHASEIDDEED